MTHPSIRGRGAANNPPNRFDAISVEREAWTHVEDPAPDTKFYRDASRTIIATNDSPDVGFEASINPYRGCEHGCVWCFARPTHEYFGLSAGLDFETKIFVKEDAPELLREQLASPKWEPKPLAMSGVTDPYQPVERRLGITRRCLEVLAESLTAPFLPRKLQEGNELDPAAARILRRSLDALAAATRRRAAQ